MNWAAIYDALASVAQLSGVTDVNARNWATQAAAGTWLSGPKLTMRIDSIRSIGVDYEHREDNVDPLQDQTVTIVGQRQFTWKVKCQTFSAAPDAFALSYLTKLRAHLGFKSTVRTLSAAGLAVVESRPIVEVMEKADSRQLSSYYMDVIMAAAENQVNTTANTGLFINEVVISSDKLFLSDGTEAPVQIVDEDIVGP